MKPLPENTEASKILRSVEADLLGTTGGTTVEWYGRAATALYRAYTVARQISLHSEDGEVILPSISCATPANTALLAKVTPRFADVDPVTGMPSLQSIQARWTPKTCAVVFIHLFGQTADLQPLAEWCRARNVLLIEDLAQALGASLPNGNAAGSVGDLAVYSFNPTKILDCGGGALIVRSGELQKVLDQVPLPELRTAEIHPEMARVLAQSYRNLHHGLVGMLRTRVIANVSAAFLNLQPAFQGLYLRRMKDPAALAAEWPELHDRLRHRRDNAEQYHELLAGGPWRLIGQWRESGVCWRYSLLVDFPEKLVQFSEAVRRDGFHVSNLYWPVNDFFRPEDGCARADEFARRVVNLWVDRTVDGHWVRRCSESLLKNAERFAA